MVWLDLQPLKGHIHNIVVELCRSRGNRGIPFAMDDTRLPETTANGSFSLSEAAATRITAMLENEPAGSFFRVAVNGGGCSGFQYEFSIDTERHEDDLEFVSHHVGVAVSYTHLTLPTKA